MAKVSISLAEFDELRGIREKFEKRVEEARKEIREELLRETSRLAEANGRLTAENANLDRQIHKLVKDCNDAELDAFTAEKKVKELETVLRNYRDEVASRERTVGELKSEKSFLEDRNRELKNDKAFLMKRNEVLEALHRKWLKENISLVDRLAALRRRGLLARIFRKGE